ncbi:hypothetical protein K525DRAFT_260624 [Schizophyllum commune Loenen D]|nr:hypothetical protein K525DRAFT_260624 [Schizophyllum commune Loenen D]
MDFDFFFCIPILFGCKTTTSPEGEQQPRICPRCHKAAVISAKQRNWFDVCWVPLFPTSTKHVWMCNICQWTLNRQNG